MLKRNIEKELQDAKALVNALEQQLAARKANTMFRCVGCEGTHKISACDAYEPMSYNSAAYEEGWDSTKEIWAVCPKTGIANRFLFDDQYEERVARAGARHVFYRNYYDKFKSLTETCRSGSVLGGNQHDIKWINNYYIDKNRKKFGLPQVKKS